MKNNFLYLLTLSLFLITSCSDDDENILDTEKPTITINEPTTDEVFAVGGEMHFDINLSDNESLASYKVDIHNNFDGHSHSGKMEAQNFAALVQEIAPWSYNTTSEIEGNPSTFTGHEHIEIPNDIAEGPYHLGIIVVDAAGNQNQAYVQFVVGENHTDEDHDISITNIQVGDGVPGSDIHAEAELSASNGIGNVSVNIHGHGLEPAEGEEAWTYDAEFPDYTGNSATFHEHIDVPENAAPGEYHMTITVIDTEGNTHAEGGHFHVEAAGEEETAITVSDFHISEEATAGADIHAEAMVNAEEGLSEIHVHIHSESDEAWELEDSFTYEGETEVEFHEHIDIPADTPAGEYHLEMEITDQAGNEHVESAHFNVIAGEA